MYPRLLQLGHIAIPTYGAFTALALIAGLAAAVHFARRLQLDPNKVWSLCLIGTLTTLIGARLLLVLVYFPAFRQHPLWVLGLTNVHDAWVIALSIAAGIGAAILYALAEGLPPLTVFDCLAPAVALAMGIHRIGAFLAGLGYGMPTTLPWSVVYTSRIAALWYRTPLGIGLHPVQVYDAAASLSILALLLWWLPRRSQPGEMAGMWLFLYGFASFFLSFYRAGTDALSFTQLLAVLAVIAGGALWARRAARNVSPLF
ncbi:phosphatidylglycerol:prolipoprotein diacylglycerol transferase [Silvibacterium bohemicum]|uniref:Phosphatidylglycerol:prolipoprotein diacylglycerol transferase n=1 Tax=Silvibacterium bohemicum TaxID=1577686 RepID=A0A841K2Y7_9BACT|nr:prolipoprotein diacylglyceryl transferase family protein [Silvibacterium bohemicum]MBB6145521.1 phosphatidylglycerol:prolipoprotein diacylglycerol transferase [Silvibacterium bohemicum]